jgi:hypothetical protein
MQDRSQWPATVRCTISLPPEKLSVSQEGLGSIELLVVFSTKSVS